MFKTIMPRRAKMPRGSTLHMPKAVTGLVSEKTVFLVIPNPSINVSSAKSFPWIFDEFRTQLQ
jgi:hypothetical protein